MQPGVTAAILTAGPAVWPLLAVSLVAVLVALERTAYLFHTRCDPVRLMASVQRGYHAGRSDAALTAIRGYAGPLARVVRCGLVACNTSTPAELQQAVAREVRCQTMFLASRIWLIGVAAAMSPLLGLAGTVQAARGELLALATGGGTLQLLAGSLAAALAPCWLGLLVGALTTGCYLALNHLVAARSQSLLLTGEQLLALLEAPAVLR